MSNFKKRILSAIILIPLALYFITQGSFMLMFFTTICFLVACYEWHVMTKKKSYKIYGFPFLFCSFFTFYELDLPIVFFVILICVSTDIGGYVFGKIFKGPKLTKISPNKTYSGMIGGFFLSILTLQTLLNLKFLNIEINLSINSILFIFLISLSSQIGDICISYFKRKSNIKDTGKLIPGHGGLLDRIDGIIFAIPAAYFIISNNLI